ncbi:hypothetical protein [Massilia sp. METH4]|uniref:hypothetical protein n=1 Tax=Massilia sp. METH4 TaxID=3123041 RepID=UPI0030D13E33
MENGDLPLARARAGMVLSDDVRDARGRVLLPRDTVLTQTQLAALARDGIAALPVRPADARLDYLFRKLDPAAGDAWAGQALKDRLRAWRAGAQG